MESFLTNSSMTSVPRTDPSPPNRRHKFVDHTSAPASTTCYVHGRCSLRGGWCTAGEIDRRDRVVACSIHSDRSHGGSPLFRWRTFMDKPHRPPRSRIALVRESEPPGFPATSIRSALTAPARSVLARPRSRVRSRSPHSTATPRHRHALRVGTLTASWCARLCFAKHKRG
jgi:hypothetical protein